MRELQKAAKPMTIVPMTKKTIRRLERSLDEVAAVEPFAVSSDSVMSPSAKKVHFFAIAKVGGMV